MTAKFKTYHRSIFSHKKAVWAGMDQGKGQLHRGDTVGMLLNVDVTDNVFTIREGQERDVDGIEGVFGGKQTLLGVSVISGTCLFFGAELGEIL